MFKISFIRKIWDKSPHNAFPDLLQHLGRWFVSFRESSVHDHFMHSNAAIITSLDGLTWQNAATIKMPGLDLRDPKLSIMPDGTLMLNMGKIDLNNDRKIGSIVSFSKDGYQWTPLVTVLSEGEWLWRLTWHQGVGYGVSYSKEGVFLYRTLNGLDYEKLTTLSVSGNPSEATIRFFTNSRMAILVRCIKNAVLVTSVPPYNHFEITELNFHIGGPNFLIVEDDKMIVAGRFLSINPYGLFERMGVSELRGDSLLPPFFLPGVGDLGYPGLHSENGELYICYYASTEQKAALYFAKIYAKN